MTTLAAPLALAPLALALGSAYMGRPLAMPALYRLFGGPPRRAEGPASP